MKNFLKKSIIEACCCSAIAFAAPSVWDGSADVSWYESSAQTYNLITAEQLAGLAKLVNDGTSDFSGKTITLGANIFLNDTAGAGDGSWVNKSHRNWIPIGTANRPFKGEFDGIAGMNNRKIYGLYVNTTSADYVGLFGYTSNIKISNLEILVGKISAKDNVGTVVGYADGGSITNVHTEVDVNGNNHVGGLVGYFTGNISKSSEKGDVVGRDSVGGLVGYTKGGISGTSTENSYFAGSVKGRMYVGGLAGYSESRVDNSHFEGDVIGLGNYVGGIAGYAYSVSKSYAKSTFVKGYNIVGGIAGFGIWIGTSYFAGDSVIGISQVGGLVGRFGRRYVSNSYSTANVKGFDNVGGLVGYQDSGSVSNSMAFGNVSGFTKLGGLVGHFDGTSISQSYANGDVTGYYYEDSANEVGNDYIGGLVGYANGSLTETYASGVVKKKEGGPVYMGCIVGYVNGSLSISKSYYDKTKCDLGVEGVENAASVSGTPGKITAEMQIQSTFADWDFTNVWRIEDDTYPFLQFFANSLTNSVVTTESLEGIVFDGLPKTPSVSMVTPFGHILMENVDYTIKYEKNVNAGTAKIIVCGINMYSECRYVDFTIEKATPIISQNPKASDVLMGEFLALSDLSGGMSDVDGVFVWKSPEIKPTLENEGYAVEFIPTDANNYNSVEFIIPIKVWDIAYVAVHLGKTTLDSIVVIKGNTYTLPMVPDSVGYNFAGFYNGNLKVGDPGDEIIVNENIVVDAVYVKTFLVKFVNGNIDLQSEELAYGSIPQYKGDSPVKNASAQWTYSFKGWDPAVSSVTGSATYTAAFDSVVNRYVVTLMNGDTELRCEELAYGTLPKYLGENPTKNATAQWTYTFKGWTPAFVPVVEPATYKAAFDSVLNKYEVAFKDYGGSILKTTVQYDYGTSSAEIVQPEKPVRQETAKYTYSFKGWNPSVTNVTKDAVYTAEYDSTIRSYQVVFVNGEKELQSGIVSYGEIPTNNGIVPTKQATAQWIYTFKGWNPSVTNVTEDAVYTAEYNSTIRSYQVVFANGEKELQSGIVSYGEIPTYNGIVPTKQATAQWTYSFKGWHPEVSSIIGPATYTATFDSVVNKYVVTFMNGDTELQSSEIAYGMVPSVPEVSLPENTAQYTYSFGGWDKPIVSVTGAETYSAVINRTLNKYEVAFKDYDGTILKAAAQYDYGTFSTNIAKPVNPTRRETAKCIYTFKGWTPILADVTENVTYVAEYDSSLQSYQVVYVNGKDVLQSESVFYGVLPFYLGDKPTKEATDSCTYKFSGWSPKEVSVTENVTYTAVFKEIRKEFIINFKNGDFVLDRDVVAYGDIPTYTGELPTKKSTKKYSYEFVGWKPEIGPAVKAVNYVAVFDSTDLTRVNKTVKSDMSISVVSRLVQISAAQIGSVYAILDMQGCVLKKGRVESPNFNVMMPQAGTYFVRIGNETQRISVK